MHRLILGLVGLVCGEGSKRNPNVVIGFVCRDIRTSATVQATGQGLDARTSIFGGGVWFGGPPADQEG